MRDDDVHDLTFETVEPAEDDLRRLRTAAGPAAFTPGFADRVMARRAARRSSPDALQYVFVRLAPLAAAAVLVMSTINFMSASGPGQPVIDRVLGLPTVSLTSAYALERDLSNWGEADR